MIPFSASDAALEGFNLIGRRWRVILGWAGFNLLALVMLVVLTVLLTLIAAAAGGGDEHPARILASGGIFVGSVGGGAVIGAGVFRLELRPDEPAFLHLRFGADEIRLILVWLITIAGVSLVAWGADLVGGALRLSQFWVVLLALAVVGYLWLRFVLVAPVSF